MKPSNNNCLITNGGASKMMKTQQPPSDPGNNECLKWINRALAKKVSGLREEFQSLKRYCPKNMCIALFLANQEAGKNRYRDVPCQTAFRVPVKWPGIESDYIHANYVSTPVNPKRFICAQGPTETTCPTFWHMIINEGTESIIMLSSIDVNDSSVKRHNLAVKWESCNPGERSVNLTHWLDWPDRGVPSTTNCVFDVLSIVRGSKKPIVVHCSAGIGRTGSIVAIEFILEKLFAGQSCESTDTILKELRNQRVYSVQNDLQYLFVHRMVLLYFLERNRSTIPSQIKDVYSQFILDYNDATSI
uniref:Protein-tyrosine phosphatase n=1 Tax=Rhabditophanes sp. KR3021 TaxID=114890 RepID=A0AC35UGC0_9BILA